MKAFNFFLLFSFALIFIQCKEKSNQENNSTAEPDGEMNPPDGFDSIDVTVFNFYSKSAMSDVGIEIQVGGVTTGHDTTNIEGSATLVDVGSNKDYTFRKQGYTAQSIQFSNYVDIDEINVYLKPDGSTISSALNISGRVYDNQGLPISNVTVSSNESNARSKLNGSYSLDIQSEHGDFPLNFVKGATSGGLNMNIHEDSVIVDVFIDGFTVDTVSVN